MDTTTETNSTETILKSEEMLNEEAKQATEQLVEERMIEDSPFKGIRFKENWYLTLGKYRLTEELTSFEACIEEAANTTWHRIMQICNIVINESDEIQELKEEINKIKEQLK